MPDNLQIRNPSISADVRISTSNEFVRTDEEGNSVIEWQAPVAADCIAPAATGRILLTERRRIILDTSSADDLLIAISNPSLSQTLKVSVSPKKGTDVIPLCFIAPIKNGFAADGIVATLNSKQRVIIQQMPR